MTCTELSFSAALENHRTICGPRGYCGPFVNHEVYRRTADPMWEGMAECVHCRNTVSVVDQFERWERSVWTRTVGFAP